MRQAITSAEMTLEQKLQAIEEAVKALDSAGDK